MKKNPRIKRVISKLHEELGNNYFEIVDHWDSDLNAIGIASPDDNKKLVYISTFGTKQDRYDAHLELPPIDGGDFIYTNAGEHYSIEFSALIALIKEHFKNEIL